jgi:hypothetical protein
MKQKTRLIERLETTLNLKAKTEAKLEALTNAYLDPDIGMPKAEYTRRRRDIEKEITGWERETQEIQGRLETEAITQERMQAIEEFAAEVAQGIELVGFEDKRKVLTMLQVSGKVYANDEEPWIELEGLFLPTQVGLSSTTSRCSSIPAPRCRKFGCLTPSGGNWSGGWPLFTWVNRTARPGCTRR